MKNKIIEQIIKILSQTTKNYNPTLIESVTQNFGIDPFIILVSTIISLRAKDITTIKICDNLLKIAKTPKDILTLNDNDLEKILFKSGFYKTKTKTIKKISSIIIEKYTGQVPKTYHELIKIPGVGPKTANLVLSAAYNISAICVDTHVHRISNRLGIIKTKKVEQTELALKKILDKKYWSIWNNLLVKHGQNICTPISPKCHKCAIFNLCDYPKF